MRCEDNGVASTDGKLGWHEDMLVMSVSHS
jgi:hypothetical protein